MLDSHLKPVQVIVAYDFSPSAEEAVLRAIELACRAPQHVLHVVAAIDVHTGLPILPPTGRVDYIYAERVEKLISERLVAAFAGRRTASEVQFYVHARIGKAADEILQVAEELGADLILIGSHGKTGLERLVLGSVSERVVREAKCAVVVARAKRYTDVELAHVIQFEHDRQPYHPPHRYVYVDRRVLKRPAEWPIS
ncbi:MAG TPA: universal stress protein [Kofleriaceae bacterium]|jgi:nucleotide-binding universal stress UspA family protein